jgi:hypothetical protein
MRPKIAHRAHGIRRLTGDPPLQPGFTRRASQLSRHSNHVSAELERRRALCRTASPSRHLMPLKTAAGARGVLMAFVLMVVVAVVVGASMGMLVAIPMPLGTTMLIPMAVRHHEPSSEQLSNNDRTSGQPATADERISHDLKAIRHSRQRQCQGRCP